MKIGITQYSYHRTMADGKMDYPGFIKKAAELGFETVDIVGYWWKDEADEAAKCQQWCKEAGIHLAAYAIRDNLATRDEAEMDEQCEQIRHGLSVAKLMNAPLMRVFGGHLADDMDDDEAFELVVKGFKKVIGDAEKAGVVLALEDHGGMPGTSGEVLKVMEAVGSEYLKPLVDLGNFLGKGQRPEEAVKDLASSACMTHVKDFELFPKGSDEGRTCKYGDYNLKGCTVGDGTIDLVACFQTLADAGYDGSITLEYEGSEDEEAGVKRSLEAIRGALAKVK